jgi:hypothetical protein
LYLAALFLCGCQGPFFHRTYKNVKAEEFVRCYDLQPSMAYRYKYIGIKKGYHVMDYYSLWLKDWSEYRYTIRTRKEDLPKNFPDHSQLKSKEYNHD